MEAVYLILVLFLVNGAAAQEDPSVEKAFDAVSSSLPGNVTKEQVEDIKNKSAMLFKEKCDKNGGPEAFSQVQKSVDELPKCLTRLVDMETLFKEVDAAKTNGTVDEVFKKYCDKTPEFKGCLDSVLNSTEPCFTSKERANIKIVHNVTEQLAEFICFKGGDRIALFIAEGGPRCFQDKQPEIQACLNSTLGTEVPDFNNVTDLDTVIPELSFGKEECRKMWELQRCTVKVLESCEQPTTANIVDSLVKFIRGVTPCKDFEFSADPQKPGSATGLAVTSLTVLAAGYTILLH